LNDVNIFAIVPIEVLADKRLTFKQMRVLIGIFSFRNKTTGIAFPRREQLSERCGGMALCQVSTATTELCELGWLSKEGKGGKSRSSTYTITIPDAIQTVTESVTVIKPVTVTKSVTQTVTESVTLPPQTVTESVRGKEQTIKTNRQGNRSITPHAMLAAMNVSNPIAEDWIQIRKTKKAAITQTAIDGIQREADKAGLSLENALRHCCERGWAGFKAEWLLRDNPAVPVQSGSKEQAREGARARLFGGNANATV